MENYQTSTTKLNNFLSGIIDIAMCFAGATITVPYTLIKTRLGLPSNYIVEEGESGKTNVTVTSRKREIYTQDTERRYGADNTAYVRVYTGEEGTARPYIFWYMNTSASIPLLSTWLSTSVNVETDNYSSSYNTMRTCDSLYNLGMDTSESIIPKITRNSYTYWR